MASPSLCDHKRATFHIRKYPRNFHIRKVGREHGCEHGCEHATLADQSEVGWGPKRASVRLYSSKHGRPTGRPPDHGFAQRLHTRTPPLQFSSVSLLQFPEYLLCCSSRALGCRSSGVVDLHATFDADARPATAPRAGAALADLGQPSLHLPARAPDATM